MKTGNTRQQVISIDPTEVPQWSPVMKTGNTALALAASDNMSLASMEPGHEDREYRAGPAGSRTGMRLNGARS